MWTFQIKPSTFLVMTTVVLVLSAAVHTINPCAKLRHDMKKEVENLTKIINTTNAKWGKTQVPKPTTTLQACPPDFFCLAEKVLEKINDTSVKQTLSTLTQVLTTYQNKNCSNTTYCQLDTDQNYSLQQFLGDVKTCLRYRFSKPKQ